MRLSRAVTCLALVSVSASAIGLGCGAAAPAPAVAPTGAGEPVLLKRVHESLGVYTARYEHRTRLIAEEPPEVIIAGRAVRLDENAEGSYLMNEEVRAGAAAVMEIRPDGRYVVQEEVETATKRPHEGVLPEEDTEALTRYRWIGGPRDETFCRDGSACDRIVSPLVNGYASGTPFYPADPVRVGERWTVELRHPGIEGVDVVELDYVLEAVEGEGDDRVAVLRGHGSARVDRPDLRVEAEVSAERRIHLSDGWSGSRFLRMEWTMSLPDDTSRHKISETSVTVAPSE